jgi:hypothetical protein
MIKRTPIPTASRLFDIAELLVVLRCRAELYWGDEDPNPSQGLAGLQPLGVAVRQLTMAARAASTALQPEPAAGRLDAFAAAVDHFWTHYCAVWPGRTRSEKLEETADFDSEQAFARDLYLYEGSPLQDGSWGMVQAAADALLPSLEPGPRACFEIGVLLGGEVWPTFTGGQRGRDAQSELAHLTVDFAEQVRQAAWKLGRDVPSVRRLEVDFAAASVMDATRRINALRRQFGDILRNPEGAPGYLGLVLDKQRARVVRGQREIHMVGDVRWGLLMQLERSEDVYCSHDSLAAIWNEPTHSFQGSNQDRFYQAILDLRRLLKPLHLIIENARDLGFRLAERPVRGRKTA